MERATCISSKLRLGGLEDRFVRILRDRISKQLKLNAADRILLSAFVAAAQIRTTQSRDHHASQWWNVLRIADDIAEAMAKATPEQRAAPQKVLSGGGPSLTHEQVRQLAAAPLQVMIPGDIAPGDSYPLSDGPGYLLDG